MIGGFTLANLATAMALFAHGVPVSEFPGTCSSQRGAKMPASLNDSSITGAIFNP